MKAMVVYDSMYGSTGRVAEAVGDALGAPEAVRVVRVGEVRPEELSGLTHLVVGSPTQRFTATGATTQFLKGISKNGLESVKVAAFDTRFTESKIEEIGILAFFVRIFGYAAEPIAKKLEQKGGELALPPEGFYVEDTEGPLLEGELERAAEWGRKIAAG